jgi:hypothetical protein
LRCRLLHHGQDQIQAYEGYVPHPGTSLMLYQTWSPR